MGLHHKMSNNKNTDKQARHYKFRRMKRAEKKKNTKKNSLIIADAELLSENQLKNRVKNPMNNITVSGKRKNKMLKRLRQEQRSKNQMDVSYEETSTTKSSESKTSKTKKTEETLSNDAEDVEMQE